LTILNKEKGKGRERPPAGFILWNAEVCWFGMARQRSAWEWEGKASWVSLAVLFIDIGARGKIWFVDEWLCLQ
jgi:hypothetical protein